MNFCWSSHNRLREVLTLASEKGSTVSDANPDHIVLDETMIRVDGQRYWLSVVTSTGVLRVICVKYDVSKAAFLDAYAHFLSAALNRAGLRFQTVLHGDRTVIESRNSDIVSINKTRMSYFTFSLDFELGWDCSSIRTPPNDKWKSLAADPTACRDTVKSILAILDEYSVPATWAVVGHLFFEQCSPEQHHRTEHIKNIDTFTDLDRDPLYYAPDLLDSIREAEVDHEIAGHSFSHPLFTDLSRKEARTELEAMTDTARAHGVELESFVFPRNEIAHEDLLPEYGIKTYRGATRGTQETIRSGIRSLVFEPGSFLSLPYVTPQRTETGATCLPASRLLRDERWWFLQPLRLKRAIRSLDTDDWIHLTVHPFNFLQQPQLLDTLRKLLYHVDNTPLKDTIEVVTMSEAHSIVNNSPV